MIKYSTDELVEEIKKPTWDYVSGELDDIIIAKLRAADKLCKAAKDNVEKCSCNFGGLDEEGRPFGKQPCDQCDPLRKAIAEYEGKEKP